MPASGFVAEAFSRAANYAQQAQIGLNTFTNSLAQSVYAPPTLDFTWSSIAPPNVEALPPTPNFPDIAVEMPTDEPTPLNIAEPTVSIDDLNTSSPSLNFGTAPTLSYGNVPSIPGVTMPTMPTMDTITIVDEPTMLALSTVTFSGVDLHPDWLLKLENLPEMTLVEPTPYSYARGPEYASTLLDALKAKLLSRMAGGTGLTPEVEQAIWDRARDRETATSQANIDEIQRQSEALGFSLPSGTLAAQMRQAQQDYYDKLSTLSRDVMVKQAELEQENLKQTIGEGMQLESKLVDYSYQLERLTFESSKQYADNAIQIYNAGVEGFKGLMAGYQTYAQAYDTIIKAEMSKVEVYKAQLQAEMTKAQINQALVEQYKATIEAQMAKVEIYKAQVGAAQTMVQLEATKINAAGEQVRAYVAQVNAETAKVEAYKATVQAEGTKVEAYKASVQAYSAKVGAQGEKARAETARYSALVQAKTAEWEGYKARVMTEVERIKALGIQSSTQFEGYKAAAQAIESKSAMYTRQWETQIKDYEAGQNLALQTAKINNDAWIQTRNAQLDAAKVGAQVYAQLAGSAYAMAHGTASDAQSFGISYSYIGEVNGTVPPLAAL